MSEHAAKLKKVRIFVTDVDGVLTDGRFILDYAGKELKMFHVHDGAAAKLAASVGFQTVLVSGRRSEVVERRAKELGIRQVYQEADDKWKVVQEFMHKERIGADTICYIGDDLADLPVLRRVGFSVAVGNAVPEVKKAVDYVTERCGGDGAFREVVELVFKAQGRWKEIVERYTT
ncbi:MAG TPA: HAD hydrolase family protein [bacterium]|nr:HAD hydrolase family protein [bacterium]